MDALLRLPTEKSDKGSSSSSTLSKPIEKEAEDDDIVFLKEVVINPKVEKPKNLTPMVIRKALPELFEPKRKSCMKALSSASEAAQMFGDINFVSPVKSNAPFPNLAKKEVIKELWKSKNTVPYTGKTEMWHELSPEEQKRRLENFHKVRGAEKRAAAEEKAKAKRMKMD